MVPVGSRAIARLKVPVVCPRHPGTVSVEIVSGFRADIATAQTEVVANSRKSEKSNAPL